VFLCDALDSVAGQSFPLIECVVANDTGKPLDVEAMGHPWVRVVDTTGSVGPAIARNTAIAAAKAPLIAILDADDMFYPDWLLTAYEAYLEYPECLVYADCDTEQKLGTRDRYNSGVFSVERIMGTGNRDAHHYPQAIYQSAILYPKQWWQAVGGYPIDQPYGMYEDWLLGVKMHLVGIGAAYCQGVAWGVYRHWTDSEVVGSKNAIDNVDHGSPEFRRKFDLICAWIERKEEEMACAGCRKKADGHIVVQGKRIPVPVGPDRVFVYLGEQRGQFSVNSVVQPGKKYRVRQGVPFTVPAGDAVHRFAGLKGFQEVVPEAEEAGARIPEAPIEPPQVAVPEPQPAPVTAPAEEEKVPERVDDLDRLGLHFLITRPLRAANIHTVKDVAFFARAQGGKGLLDIKGISEKRLGVILEALEAYEAGDG